VSRRPPPRKSGRAPRREAAALALETLEALMHRMCEQNAAEPLHATSKAHRLVKLANDLEVSVICRAAPAVTAGLALDVAAFALRLFEQGD
jgi:hypothetical protein